MIYITGPQMTVFEQQAEARLVALLAADLREHQSEAVEDMPDEDLAAIVKNGIGRARSHGFTTEASLAGYLGLMFDIAPNFDESPAVRAVFADPALDEDERLTALFARLSEADWDAAVANHDDSAWVRPCRP